MVKSNVQKIDMIIRISLLVILTGMISYLNFSKLVLGMTTDCIAELNYGRLVWEEKTFFPSTWYYANEFMFFRPAILFSVIYGITNQYLLSASITLTIVLFIVFGAFVYFCKSFGCTVKDSLLGMLLIFSWGGTNRRHCTFNISLLWILCILFGCNIAYHWISRTRKK